MKTEEEIRKQYCQKVILPIIIKYFDKKYKGKPIIIATLKDYMK